MKRCTAIGAVLILGFSIYFTAGLSYAQEEKVEFSYGEVSRVSADEIVIKEYDFDKEKEVEIPYTAGVAVKLDNVSSMKDIAVGDMVDIKYVLKGDKRIATGIFVDRESYLEETEEGEYPPLETQE